MNQSWSKIEPWSIQNPKPLYVCFSGHSTPVILTVARLTSVQENLEGNLEIKKTFEIVLVSLMWVRLTSVQENREGRPDVARSAADAFEPIFESEITNIEKNTIPQHGIKPISKEHENNVKRVAK